MRFNKISVFLLSIILLVNVVLAQTIITIDVDDKGNSVFVGTTDANNISLPEGIDIDNGKIFGETSSLTSKAGEVWTFSVEVKDSQIKIILPKGAAIDKITNGEISSEKSQISIIIEDGIVVSYKIKPVLSSYTIYYIIGIVIIIILALLYYIFNSRKKITKSISNKTVKNNKLAIISKILSEREKLILNELRKTGKTKMSFLRKSIDMPKASFSRHVQELEKKGLIKRSGEGKNKFVEIK